MSDFAWGFVHTEKDLQELSFCVQRIALNNGFALKTGYNVFNYLLENFIDSFRLDVSKNKGALPFEVISSPLDDNTENLLTGDPLTGCEIVECLLSRMKRIEAFIRECLQIGGVTKIELNINIDFAELNNYNQYTILSEDFADLMLVFYKKCENSTPSVRFLFEEE